VSRAVDILVPRRLGADFRWLLGSSWASNLGDGISIAAGPLLVASQTDDPFLVALAVVMNHLPQMLFALVGGALADRLDRRLLVALVDLLRAGVLAVLCVSIATGRVSITVVLVATFLVGTAEVFADTASSTLMPMLVEREDLGVANARLLGGFVTANQLAGPPIGAALFALGATWPFLTQAILVASGALLVSRVSLPQRQAPPPSRLRSDIAEGFRWVLHHAAVRTLVLTIVTFNVTFGAAWSVLVLWARARLGLDEVGFGLLTTVSALGGVVGTAGYGAIARRLSMGDMLRIGLVLETLTHLGLALTTSPAVAYAIFFVFGAHAFVWATTSTTVRQRAVPEQLQGRVNSVNLVATVGGMVVGSALGGLIAQAWGVTAPFWFAFAGSAVFLVLIWRQLAHVTHSE
jgi:predicted MFS family arabinose efflux permease